MDILDAPSPTWEQLENGLVAVRTVVHGLVDYIQNHSKKGTDQQQVKTVSICMSYLATWVQMHVVKTPLEVPSEP